MAAVTTAAILFLATIAPWWASRKNLPVFWSHVVNQTVFPRYTNFSKGVIGVGDLTFFVLTTAVFLFLTVKVDGVAALEISP